MRNRIQSLKMHIDKIGLLETLFYSIQRKFRKKGSLLRVRVKGLEKRVLLRNGFYDTHIFHQIFVREEVNFKLPSTPEIIIDCGANIGLSALYFKSLYPDCTILSFEPEYSNYQLLCLNIVYHKNITAYHAAVWYENTTVNVIDNGTGHASFQTTTSGSEKMIASIPAKSLSHIIRESDYKNIDLIKIDIEGSEFEIFAHDPINWIDRSTVIAVEIHEDLKPGSTNLIETTMNKRFSKKQFGEYTVFFKNQAK